MAHLTKPRAAGKRAKHPLTLHKPTGQYRKRIRGKDYYFGTDADLALAEWLRVKDDLLAGRSPKAYEGENCDLKTLCNVFLTNAKAKRDAGEITGRTFADYFTSCERLVKQLGKTAIVEEITPSDLMALRRKLSKTMNSTTLGNEVNRCRVILRSAFENALTDRPMRFGDFKRPAMRVKRREKAANGSKLFEATEITKLLEAADVQLNAMILLGVNCGFGNSDCGQLPEGAVNLETGWIDYPRPKTGIARRCPLWSETVEALKAALAARKSDSDSLVFRTKYGQSWHTDTKASPLSAEFRKLCQSAGVYQTGRGFYALRHTFQTIGDEPGDYLATRQVMGHADNSMSGNYRERFPDDRLVKVTEHIHGWLFPEVVAE